jgi:hypothetical protein
MFGAVSEHKELLFVCMSKIAVLRGDSKRRKRSRSKKLDPNEVVRRIRVGELNHFFSVRYGNGAADCGWRFPDDDAGLEDLKILAHHYATNPAALSRIIKLRAPWAMAEDIPEEVATSPKRWTSKQLGKLLNLSGNEWRIPSQLERKFVTL